ncbi:MAG: ParA family protein [Clostridia bacterium]|nr:ParA family protein [Clostridia bacterium]
MGKIIAVMNQKGGVGKTTTAVNLCACLAELGKKTLLVDADPQGNATSGVGAAAGEQTLYEVLLGMCTPEKAVVKAGGMPGMDVMPSDIRLVGAEVELVGMERREYRLRAALRALGDRYDYVIVDCPPSLGLLTVNALTAANSVLIPIQCEYYALEGVRSLTDTVARVKHGLNPALDVEGVLLTMFDGRTNLSLQVAAQVKKHFRAKVFATAVPRNVRLGEAPSHALPINRYDPRSTGAEAYRALAREVLARNGERVKG